MNSLDILNPLTLSNGLKISVCDHTRVYFGDYYLVRLEIIFTIDALDAERMLSEGDSKVHHEINYSRFLVKMGVPSTEVASVKNELLSDFKTNSLAYISTEDFPKRLFERQSIIGKAPGRRFTGATS